MESAAKVLSRSEILRVGREILAGGVPSWYPLTARDFDVPPADLEFVGALWCVCFDARGAKCIRTDMGMAFQYGPYILMNRGPGRGIGFETHRNTAAAVRRLAELGSSGAPELLAYMVVADASLTGPSGSELAVEPGDLLQRGDNGLFAKVAPGWVGPVSMSDEQVASLRPVRVMRRDFGYLFVDPEDQALYKRLTGRTFVEG